jgi:molybdate transport system substrate-binding protein
MRDGITQRFSRRITCLALWLAVAALALPAALQAQQKSLTVSAAISLKDALDEINPLWSKAQPGVALHFNYGASGTLQQQIQQGAPVDVYISASPDQMDALAHQDMLLAGTRHDLVGNSIVLIVPSTAKSQVSNFKDLLGADVKFVAIGDPQAVPAGKYAQETLTKLGLYDQLQSKFILGKDVRQVLTYVATGNADAGIVYATDAKITPQVKVATTAPEDSHAPIIYPVGVIKFSQNPEAAKAFVTFLESAQALSVFEKYGFKRE